MLGKMLRKTMIYGFIGIFLGMLIIFPLVQNIPQVLTDKNQIIVQDNLDNKNLFSQDNYNVLNSPFFENTTPISDWLKNEIIDNSTVQDNPDFPMYFSETSQDGNTITNDTHNFEDFAVFLDGLVNLLDMSKYEISQYFNTYMYSEFWDSNVSQQGYYSWVNSDWSDNSTVKELDGNSQIILTFIDWLISDQSNIETYNVENYISNQWDVQNDLFYDSTYPTYQVYNHSTTDSSKFAKDQFIAAIAGFLIHRANNGDLTIQDEAFSDANATMAYMLQSQFFDIDSFKYRREPDLSIGAGFDEFKFLGTNAYAIWALSEWYLELGAPEEGDQKYADTIENAEIIFHTINDTLWNETYSLFMNGMSAPGSIYDSAINLKDNSIMLMAMQKLFEVTGNFTYYEVCVDMFNGIQNNFEDPDYGSYYNLINATGDIDKNKNLNSLSYLFRSLNSLSSLSERIDTNITTNATEFIKKESISVNITAEYFFDLYNYYDQPNAEINYSVPIENADFFFSVRFPNGTLAYNVTQQGDLNGTASIEFPFLDDYPLGDYTVDMYANYTGILTSLNQISFSLIPGFWVQEYSLDSESIRAGSSTFLNLTINNTRMENLTVSIDLNGTNFVNQTFEQVLLNGTLNNFTYDVISLANASFGSTSLIIEIRNDSTLNYIIEIPIVILSSIEIERIEQDAFVFHDFDFNILVELQNFVDISQTVDISITGEYIADIEMSKLLSPEESVIVLLNTQISDNAPYGEIMYNINITRASDGNIISYEDFISIVKLPLDILLLDVPEISYHGKESQASCYIMNNLKSSQNITIIVDNTTIISNLTLIPGENLVDIPFGQNFMNPYEFGNKYYLIEILDSNGNKIYEQLVTTELKTSVASILLGYALPLIIPIAGIVIVRHMALENKKRLS
jgi:subtilisin-like proprotein convertase family protein